MPTKPRILCVCDSRETIEHLSGSVLDSFEAVVVPDSSRALASLASEQFEGVYVASDRLGDALDLSEFLRNGQILAGIPDGVVLLDGDNTILWSNERFREWAKTNETPKTDFYAALGNLEILGPDFCPFHTALATGTAASSTLRSDDNRYFHLHAVPVRETAAPSRHLIVTVRDVTGEMLQQQKLAAIHQAGTELADLSPEDLLDMAVDERIELLKSNILHFTKDLLKFDVAEIRLLDSKTSKLEPLLSVGMEPMAARRELYAQPQNNGVTGFVAATGKSYICEETSEDPLYLEGVKGAKSSLTVPLVLHDEVIGTFNVESPEPRAFSESDRQFLEVFSRDVAVALNTLELLVAEKACSTAASVEAIHSAVALPVDDILNETVNVMERYIGHEPEVVHRLQKILRNARNIKQVIQKIGQKMAPAVALPQPPEEKRPALEGRRVLLVDEDHEVRSAAHDLLDRHGCVVETAPDGAQAMFMVRNSGYDAIIADIRLPDMTGYEFMLKLKEVMDIDPLPLVLMTGFGWDPGHSIVKSRQAGLQAVLYKPFRLDQLLTVMEQVVSVPANTSS